VHSAVLAGSRKEVVIKVLRPGTEDVLLTDLNFVSTVYENIVGTVQRYMQLGLAARH
jgi:predicted unusual protein kinase regulating ubiquinone biosynthesis (AarF/ABC1/UbiB family)